MAKRLKVESSKKKEKWKIFSMQDGIEKEFLKGPQIEMFGNKRIIIEGCLGVYEYNQNYLKLRLKNGALILCGNDFDISSFEESTITVGGKISTLEFCE